MNDTFMKERPVFPLILSMALPMVISMLVNSLYNIVDSFFVAKISEDAMTALSLVFPVQNFINAVAIGFGVGINAQISFQLGAKNIKNANIAATHGMLFNIIHGIIFTVSCIPFMPVFLSMFTKAQEVISSGVQYSTIAFAFSTVIMISLSFEKIFQAVGRMKLTMISLMIGCISNIILDPLLIFGIGFFPKLGIKGAALATGIGQTVTSPASEPISAAGRPDGDPYSPGGQHAADVPPTTEQLAALAAPWRYTVRDGKKIGEHSGAHFYTIGQRKGLGIGGRKESLFILATDTVQNVIYVGEGDSHPGLWRQALHIAPREIHWVNPARTMPAGQSARFSVRIRYRQPLQEATLFVRDQGAYILFDAPQRGITPGQFAAWYDGDELVGSGVISE